MNKTTYFYPNFFEFQIVCRGPQMTSSRAACGREFETSSLENVLLRHAFTGPQPPVRQRGRFWREISTLAPLSDLSYNAVGPFSAFLYIMAQWRKLPSFIFVPNSGQIWRAVQNGKKSNLPGHCTVLELHQHATEVWLDRSSWIPTTP